MMFGISSKKKYDENKRNKAFTGLTLRVVVAGYILYLAYMIVNGSSESSMPLWTAVVICVVFVVCGLLFAAYSVRGFIKAIKDAEIIDEDSSDEQ